MICLEEWRAQGEGWAQHFSLNCRLWLHPRYSVSHPGGQSSVQNSTRPQPCPGSRN